jgi:prepilin-type N-terminal cleavage/methylation domain-containing protein
MLGFNGKKQHGFSLLELGVVIVIIGVLVMIASTRLTDSAPKLMGQVNQLTSDIRYVQSLALTRNMWYRINFNSAGNNYTFTDLNDNPIAHPASTSVTTPNTINLPAGFSLSTTNIPSDGGVNKLAFDGMGAPYVYSGGVWTALTSDAEVTLTADNKSLGVTITPQTGMVGIS